VAVQTKEDLRVIVQQDMLNVFQIDMRSFDYPWNFEELNDVIRQRNVLGQVSDRFDKNGDRQTCGFMLYEIYGNRLQICRLAVDPDHRRQGVASGLVKKLIARLNNRRGEIVTVLRESNLEGQLFYQKMGFIATGTLRRHFTDTDEDGYRFIYRLGW